MQRRPRRRWNKKECIIPKAELVLLTGNRGRRSKPSDYFHLSRNPRSHNNDKENPYRLTETGNLPAAVAALGQDVVFHSPVLATISNEIRGLATAVKILQTAFTCVGMPRNLEEFHNSDGRYIVTFDGSADGNLMQVVILIAENADNKIESIRLFARPWSVVKLFRDFMERQLRPDPIPEAIWNLPTA